MASCPTTFTITVGSATVQPTGSISIIAGQGQLLTENVNTSIPGFGSPSEVLVTDLNGKPVSGVPVIFTDYARNRQFVWRHGQIATGAVINSNSNGMASAAFLSSVVPNGLGSTQTQITATSLRARTSVTFYETTYPPIHRSPRQSNSLPRSPEIRSPGRS